MNENNGTRSRIGRCRAVLVSRQTGGITRDFRFGSLKQRPYTPALPSTSRYSRRRTTGAPSGRFRSHSSRNARSARPDQTRPGVLNFLLGWIKALRWRLPEMERLGDILLTHIDGIAAYCDHRVRFGVVESVNATIKGGIRRARGMRDEAFLVLKLKWATARPIRNAHHYAAFIQAQPLHSNR